MQFRSLSFYRFHVSRYWRAQPLVVALMASSITIALIGAVAYGYQRHALQAATADWQRLHAAPRIADSAASGKPPALPAFQATQLVGTLHRIADETKLPLDEIQFALEESGNQPYLRYRATLSVSAGYPAIRRFIDRMQQELAEVSLDTISCARDDIAAKELTCDVALSAFYRKAAHE